MSEFLLTTENLTKVYSKKVVVDNVNLHIKRGSIYGLIGRNGAGKTTFMKMITGVILQSSGTFNYEGFECTTNEALSHVGALIEYPALYPDLSAYDNIKLKAIAYGVDCSKKKIRELLHKVGLDDVNDKKIRKYSYGMRQRLGIAMALVSEPDFLVLDEPINGLDPQGIAEVRDLLIRLNKENGITILISSHILEELAKLVTDYAIIENGKIIEESTREELQSKCTNRITILSSDMSKILPVIESAGITKYSMTDNRTLEIFERVDEAGEINALLVKQGIAVESISVTKKDLETYFLDIIRGN